MTFFSGAYGLPKLKATAGYCLRDEFEEDFVFEYPRSWVARRNSQREGVVVSNFDVSGHSLLLSSKHTLGSSLCLGSVSPLRRAFLFLRKNPDASCGLKLKSSVSSPFLLLTALAHQCQTRPLWKSCRPWPGASRNML